MKSILVLNALIAWVLFSGCGTPSTVGAMRLHSVEIELSKPLSRTCLVRFVELDMWDQYGQSVTEPKLYAALLARNEKVDHVPTSVQLPGLVYKLILEKDGQVAEVPGSFRPGMVTRFVIEVEDLNWIEKPQKQ